MAAEVLDATTESELRRALVGVGEGDTKVLDAAVALRTDEDANEYVSILLSWPRPANRRDGWDVSKTQLVKREARRIVDELLSASSPDVRGMTVVSLTTSEASPQDIAADEAPQPGEGVAAGGTVE